MQRTTLDDRPDPPAPAVPAPGAPTRRRRRATFLGLALAPMLMLVACGGEAEPSPATADEPAALARNIVLISIDTLRADRLGCYGYERDTSPFLDAYAKRSLLFTNATSAATNTTPSHMSMFTGLHASVHGMFNVEFGEQDGEGATVQRLPATIPMLAERLAEAGFHCTALTDGGYLTRELQFDRGFHEFLRKPQTIDDKVDAALVLLARADATRRQFFFLHTYEVHAPYVPPVEHDLFTQPAYDGPYRERIEELRAKELGGVSHAKGFLPTPKQCSPADLRYLSDLYDGGIHFTDAELGRFLAALEKSPWAGETAVIIVSDHGEAFLEHGSFSHGELYQTVSHVPFMVRLPDGRSGRVETPVSGVDVTPTILHIAGLPAPEITHGTSVLGRLDPARPIVSYRGDPRLGGGIALRRDETKVLRNMARLGWERYDLASDPGELQPMPLDDPDGQRFLDLIEDLGEEYDTVNALLHQGADGAGETLSPETLEELRALGYLGDG